jgi:hypothetical protein
LKKSASTALKCEPASPVVEDGWSTVCIYEQLPSRFAFPKTPIGRKLRHENPCGRVVKRR